MPDPIDQTISFKSWIPLPGEALRRFERDELEQTSFRPTVVIGIGGTGLAVVRSLKQLVRASFGEEEREIFQFAVFDTTREETPENEEPLDPGEFVHLGAFDAAGIIRHLDENPYVAGWWPGGKERPYQVDFSGNGAHRVRAVGRLVFYHYINRIVTTLENKIRRAININSQHGIGAESIKFYIVCSLAGGTGSGMVLDMAYLARKLGLATQLGCYLTGLLVIDDPFLAQVETANTQAELSANVYAALREMNHFYATRTFHERYNRLTSTMELHRNTYRPFDVAYLLGLHNRSQALESFDTLTRMIAAEMYLEIASPMTNATTNQLDNLRAPRRAVAGQPTPFSSFAVSALDYPLAGVSSWCALRAYEAFSKQIMLQPLVESSKIGEEVAAFMQAAHVEEVQDDQILDRLILDDKGQPMLTPAISHSQVGNLPESQLLGMMQHMEQSAQAEAGEIRERIALNVHDIQTAFVHELTRHAEHVTRDPRRGARYVTWLLQALRDQLYAQRDETMMGEQAMYSDLVQAKEGDWQAARVKLEKALRLPSWWPFRKSRISRARDERVAAFNAYVDAIIECEKRTQAVQCQNSFANEAAALARRANDLVSGWLKMAEASEERAAGEVSLEMARQTHFSLMRSIVSNDELEQTFTRHVPRAGEPAEHESMANQCWEFIAQRIPLWTLAGDGPVLAGEENPAVQVYYFLADWYRRRLQGKELIERLQEMYGSEWKRIIELRYDLTQPFWRFTLARHGSTIDDNLEHEPRLVGYGGEPTERWATAVSRVVGGVTAVNTRNPHQLMILRTAHGLPLFAMPDVTNRMRVAYEVIRAMWEAGDLAGEPIPVHISDAWILRDIFPLEDTATSGDEEAEGTTGQRSPNGREGAAAGKAPPEFSEEEIFIEL